MAGRLILQARKGFSSLIRSQRSMTDYAPSKYRPYHMDDFPVPSGSWEEGYRKKQAGYNRFLAFGITFFAITVTVVKQSGLIKIFLIPPLPSEIDYQTKNSE